MYKGKRVLAIVPANNEEAKIGEVVRRTDLSIVDLLVVDDGSTDSTPDVARKAGATVLSLPAVEGVGYALRTGIEYGREHGYDIAVIMAGNNKDDPTEIPRLLDPICDSEYDFVMGSRYLQGGGYGGDMPRYRKLATRLHPWLISKFVRKPVTESTNGFRAFKLSLLDDTRINLNQAWLNEYGLEVYLLIRTLQLGYKWIEVPCTKIYPSRQIGNTKMKPVSGWWSILQPVFLTGMGIRQ